MLFLQYMLVLQVIDIIDQRWVNSSYYQHQLYNTCIHLNDKNDQLIFLQDLLS